MSDLNLMGALDALEQLANKATPGPFRHRPGTQSMLEAAHWDHSFTAVAFSHIEDVEYVAALLNAAPALIAEVRRLTAENEALRTERDVWRNKPDYWRRWQDTSAERDAAQADLAAAQRVNKEMAADREKLRLNIQRARDRQHDTYKELDAAQRVITEAL